MLFLAQDISLLPLISHICKVQSESVWRDVLHFSEEIYRNAQQRASGVANLTRGSSRYGIDITIEKSMHFMFAAAWICANFKGPAGAYRVGLLFIGSTPLPSPYFCFLSCRVIDIQLWHFCIQLFHARLSGPIAAVRRIVGENGECMRA